MATSLNYNDEDMDNATASKNSGPKEESKMRRISAEDMTSRDFYQDPYAHFSLHEEILKDEVITSTYRDSIILNCHLFAGKIVMDVGCGTGILSMFAAKAGAQKVFAIECSNIVHYVDKIVEANKLGDIIQVIKGKVEEVQLPDGIEKVDIIISQWMGYCLFYENMLDSVIFARDKWLKPDGLLFPDRCSLFIAAIEDELFTYEKINWWDDVYGFDMSPIRKDLMSEPLVDFIDLKQVITNECLVKEVDLYSVKTEDLNFSSPFILKPRKDEYMHGIVTFFKVDFTKCHTPIGFSTAPGSRRTHWKQTLFYFKNPLIVQKEDDIRGCFTMKRHPREQKILDIGIEVTFKGISDTEVHEQCNYRMR